MDSREQSKSRVQASATTNTYVFCRTAARDALKQAESVQSGGIYFCMMAGVFAAFTVEGYLNHLGLSKVQDWDSLERKLGPREKLLLLRQLLKLTADESRRPFQTLHQMLNLRDALAHAKTETKTFDGIVKGEPSEEHLWPEPKWKQLCTLEQAKRMVDDAEAMVLDLHNQTGSSRDPFVGLGHARSGISEAEVE